MSQRFFGKGNRLYKREKLCSKVAIDRLFAARPKKDCSITDRWGTIDAWLCYPLRMVAGQNPDRGGAPVQFLVSVPKKRLRHAVDRVTMRRRIREAYRLAETRLQSENTSPKMDVAFIYVADKTVDSARINRAMARLLSNLPAYGQ